MSMHIYQATKTLILLHPTTNYEYLISTFLLLSYSKCSTSHRRTRFVGAIALSYPPPPIVIDDSSWKNAAESFTVALTLTLGGYESAIVPICVGLHHI